jgi:hypothetical protein
MMITVCEKSYWTVLIQWLKSKVVCPSFLWSIFSAHTFCYILGADVLSFVECGWMNQINIQHIGTEHNVI